ncbi:MAG: hypothetical protein B6U72_06240 [Candidatus Altiarchaeales archaeon ex4484_2]|nr:MAG: hypothetical protein B6U72_06240 [Candidatus Altiarchaeales archaeon ex4484_2]
MINNSRLFVLKPDGYYMIYTYNDVKDMFTTNPTQMTPQKVFNTLYGINSPHNPYSSIQKGDVGGGAVNELITAADANGALVFDAQGNVLDIHGNVMPDQTAARNAVNTILVIQPVADTLKPVNDFMQPIANFLVGDVGGAVWNELTAPRDFFTHVPVLNDLARFVGGNELGNAAMDLLLGVHVDEDDRVWTSFADLGIDALYAADGIGAIGRLASWAGKIDKVSDTYRLLRNNSIVNTALTNARPLTKMLMEGGNKTYDLLKNVGGLKDTRWFRSKVGEIFESSTVEGYLIKLGEKRPFNKIFNQETRSGRFSINSFSSYCNFQVGDLTSGALYGVKSVFEAAPASLKKKMSAIIPSVGTLLEVGTLRSYIDGNTDALKFAEGTINTATNWYNGSIQKITKLGMDLKNIAYNFLGGLF